MRVSPPMGVQVYSRGGKKKGEIKKNVKNGWVWRPINQQRGMYQNTKESVQQKA